MTVGKIGLALGGGAARGWAHIGVVRALLSYGIKPDIIAGTSMGAVVGGCYLAQQLDALEEFARSLTKRRIFGYLDLNLAGSGLITGQKLCDKLQRHLANKKIEDLAQKFAAVATEIGTGHEVWLTRGPLVDAIRASYALPGIFKPVKINDRWLFDGALVNPIPVSICRAFGARYVIAVNLNFDISSRSAATTAALDEIIPSGPSVTPSEFKAQKNNGQARRLLSRQLFGEDDGAPGISTVMMEAFSIVQDRIARSRLAGDPPDALITPRLHGIGLFDFHRAEELIERGETATKRAIEDIVREIKLRREIENRISAYA